MQFTTPKRQTAQAPERQNTMTPRRTDAVAPVVFDHDPLIRELVAGMGERNHRVTRAVKVAMPAAPSAASLSSSATAPSRRWLGGALLALGGAAAVLLATAGGAASGRVALSKRPTGGVSAAPVEVGGGQTWI